VNVSYLIHCRPMFAIINSFKRQLEIYKVGRNFLHFFPSDQFLSDSADCPSEGLARPLINNNEWYFLVKPMLKGNWRSHCNVHMKLLKCDHGSSAHPSLTTNPNTNTKTNHDLLAAVQCNPNVF